VFQPYRYVHSNTQFKNYILTYTQLYGQAQEEANRVGVKSINISISHSDDQAVSVAIAQC
jgi:phosphopantetheinyl transferase (holo-ACP synthase)